MATEPTKPTTPPASTKPKSSHEHEKREPAGPNIMDVTPFAVPAKDDYENPILSQAEEDRKRQEEQQKANQEVLEKEGEQALEYVRQGETRPSESDIKWGVSHPSVPNRPGFAPEPTAPYPVDYDRPLSKRTQDEQKAGKAAAESGPT